MDIALENSARRLLQGVALVILISWSPGPARAEDRREPNEPADRAEKTLYIWAGDAERRRPDFLAVIDFDERSPHYGRVVRTVPLPPPGNVGNEPHHCHLSTDKTILACGGLLSVLRGQNGIFFFDVSNARHPELLFSTMEPVSPGDHPDGLPA